MNKKAFIYNSTNSTQKAHKIIIPTTRHTATLIQFYFIPHRRLPTSIYTKTQMKEKRKGVATSLSASSLLGPLVRTGWWQNGARSVSSAQYRDHGLIAPAPGSPLLVVDDSREGCADSRADDERPTKRQQVKQAPDTRGKIHARAPELQTRKRKEDGVKREHSTSKFNYT